MRYAATTAADTGIDGGGGRRGWSDRPPDGGGVSAGHEAMICVIMQTAKFEKWGGVAGRITFRIGGGL